MASQPIEPPPILAMDKAFWLRRSLGFRVEMPDGSVGVVRKVLASGEERVSVSIAVVVPSGLPTFVADLDDVRAVYPLRLRLVLNRSAA
ncbi:MAG: hypothetical protein QOJ13_979 [Gaiellales bacterium]|nr:hypothetical protein [Gaiellales bacterium]